MRGLQCPKSLYLYKNFIQKRDPISAEQKAIFSRGNNVGTIAQKLFPGGINATPQKYYDYISAVNKTQQLINEGVEIIYEAAFQFEQVLSIIDVLVKKPSKEAIENTLPNEGNQNSKIQNQWFAYEVKSSTKISQSYLLDASLQYWVITNSGIPLEDISIITINNQYIKQGAIKLDDFFSINSVKKEALQNQLLVGEKVMLSKLVVENLNMPEVNIGEHCFSPYNCDFMGTCWKKAPKNSIFEIMGIQKKDLFILYNQGIKTIAEIPDNNLLDKNANIHIQSFKNGTPRIDIAAIKTFIEKIEYPLYFMDFESFMPAIPLYNETKPYQHIPFQYSLHYKKSKETREEHFYFLAEQGSDPRKHFLENLLNHIENKGSIIVYDALMERNILNSLKKQFPEHAAQIDLLLLRIVDLMIPFQNRSYYHPAMKNSHSIKNILHALIPTLSYTNLKISSGSIAMIAFEALQTETDLFKIIETKENLLEYCKLDTLSMVKIYEILEQQ